MLRNQKIQRAIAAVVLATFTSLTMYPLTAAAQAHDAMEKAGLLPRQQDAGFIGNTQRYLRKLAGNGESTSGNHAATTDERFAQLLNEIHEDLKAVTPQTALSKQARGHAPRAKENGNGKSGMETRAIGPTMRIDTERGTADTLKALPGTDISAHVKHLRSKAAAIRRLYPDIEQSFKDTEQYLKQAKLPQEILHRHQEAVAQYQSRKAEFDRLMGKIEHTADSSANQQAALAELGSFMAQYPNAKPHQYTDPDKLPFRTPDGKVRKPFESKEQYQASLFPPRYEKVMLAGPIPDGLKLTQVTLPQANAKVMKNVTGEGFRRKAVD